MNLTADACYEAVASRDRRFDGRFFTGVVTTGVYCRPGCPARTPRRPNVRFYPSAAAAEEAGFRPCLKCRPETSPGAPPDATSEVVARALAAIAEGALDGEDLDSLAERLGVGPRHLRRLFRDELGASPHALALTRRVHFARRLLGESALPITQIALASGFQSIRSFNDAFRATFGASPSTFRRRETSRTRSSEKSRLRLKLAYRPPLAWRETLAFLARRAIPGVESVEGDVYARAFAFGKARGVLRVRALEGEAALELCVPASAVAELRGLVERVRRLFDLDLDPAPVAARLARDPALRRRVRAVPGLRVPGAFDPFELAIRAVLGQQIAVARASKLAGRLVELFGERAEPGARALGPFPRPETLARAEIVRAGMPRARAEAVRALAAAVASGTLRLDRARPSEEVIARLEALPGIGTWTAQYVALRALGEPDAFPSSDLGLRKALARPGETPLSAREVEERAEAWRPWRAYAALYLWSVP
jgi:AraC family transcriptional regulator of adaptative response / DNA-3-methyladenine glycosylase II